jgi:hypothetical protein
MEEGFATLYTHTYSARDWDPSIPEDENTAINITPIRSDGSIMDS